jgi:hypothetical protein
MRAGLAVVNGVVVKRWPNRGLELAADELEALSISWGRVLDLRASLPEPTPEQAALIATAMVCLPRVPTIWNMAREARQKKKPKARMQYGAEPEDVGSTVDDYYAPVRTGEPVVSGMSSATVSPPAGQGVSFADNPQAEPDDDEAAA